MSSGFDSFNQLNFKLVKLAISKAKDEGLSLNLDTIIELSSVSEASIVSNNDIVELLKTENIEVSSMVQTVKKQKNVVLDLETFDIFEDIEDIESISNIQIIEDVQIIDSEEGNIQAPADNKVYQNDNFANNIDSQVDNYYNDLTHGGNVSGDYSDSIQQQQIDQQASSSTLSKFVGAHKTEVGPAINSSRLIPSEIKKACAILGLDTNNITKESVMAAWKKELSQGQLHPDLGGSTEDARLLNTAKDALLQYIDSTAPKLGKKFGRNKK